jgi:large subunit ribosomal protein L3
MAGILGQKLGMTRIFDEKGVMIPVTVVEAGPCYITQIKTEEREGYSSVQLAFKEIKESKVTKPLKGHFAKAGVAPQRFIKEFEFKDRQDLKVGDPVTVAMFTPGTIVKVTGTTKGKGFQGVVRRHNFRGGPVSHGQSDRLRAPGSLGQSSYPSRVYKGIRMAGRMGGDRQTLGTVTVVKIDTENNLIFLRGPVPGAVSSLVEIRN